MKPVKKSTKLGIPMFYHHPDGTIAMPMMEIDRLRHRSLTEGDSYSHNWQQWRQAGIIPPPAVERRLV